MEGEFQKQDAVSIWDDHNQEIARGLSNYSSQDLQQILGCKTDAIAQILNYASPDLVPEVVHRDNLVLVEHLPNT